MSNAKLKLGDGLTLPLDALVGHRALIQGASGSGKSMLLRLICEQAAERVPILLIDPESEFATLRERHDFVIVGHGGELPASPKNAAKLARRLLELHTSAVIGLYELARDERHRFVREFLGSLIAAPRNLWKPTIVPIDEAHQFCPEKGAGESIATQAVIDLMSLGRKRGLAGLLVTQRLSKLNKNAASECGHVFIGRTSPIDQARAADLLGVPAAERHQFADLAAGEWFATGPGLNTARAVKFAAALPQTTHPKTGQSVAPPAPSAKIKSVAGELNELAAKPDDEPVTLEQALARIAALRGELRKAEKAPAMGTVKMTLDVQRAIRELRQAKEVERAAGRAEMDRAWRDDLAEPLGCLAAFVVNAKIAKDGIERLLRVPRKIAATNGVHAATPPVPAMAVLTRPAVSTKTSEAAGIVNSDVDLGDVRIGKGERRMLDVLLARHPARLTEAQWATLAGLKRTGGTWGTYKSRLRVAGLVVSDGEYWTATDGAVAQFGGSAAPAGNPLEEWKAKLGTGPAKMIDALHAHGGLSRAALAEICELTANAGTFGTYLSRLRANGVVTESGGMVALAEELW